MAADDIAERLYGLPLEEFTAERDSAARELRREGSKEDADKVKSLKKPSAPAWALNQLARTGDLDDALAAGEELREAQEEVLGGGDRDRLRAAVEAERGAIDSAVKRAGELLGKPSAQMLERVRDTLHAASGDDEVRDRLRSGRLVEDAKPVGLGPMAMTTTSAKPKEKAKGKDKKESAEARRRREQLSTARAEAKRAEHDAERARRRLEEAEAELESAREEAESALKELERKRDEVARLEKDSG